jgi:hypothetical protein
VSSSPKVNLSALATKMMVAARAGKVASLRKLHHMALINRPLGSARNLETGSRLLQLSPVSHVHIGRRASSHLAGPSRGICECPFNFFKGLF